MTERKIKCNTAHTDVGADPRIGPQLPGANRLTPEAPVPRGPFGERTLQPLLGELPYTGFPYYQSCRISGKRPR